MKYLLLVLLLISCTAKVDTMKVCKSKCASANDRQKNNTSQYKYDYVEGCEVQCEVKDLEDYMMNYVRPKGDNMYKSLALEIETYIKSRNYQYINK